ncbi:hypothetical protein PQO03_00150 [Lentisphaera profundi]|uniref:DUF4178 domain-containing protein n=1 Tax=Lentisphaera profundi TaxID=1658616 RepID=A0ABY7VRM4_9BACT|nr:hypothetical protein [Lentisphaera profundi]WDE96379.1 hypothetical protein PQO03_00150 [Lentisphaera profundi]
MSWTFKANERWGEFIDSELNTSFTVESKATRTYTLNIPYNSSYDESSFYSPSFRIEGPGVDQHSKVQAFGKQLESGKICTQQAYKKIELYGDDEREKKKKLLSKSRSSASSFVLDYEYSYFDSRYLNMNWQSYSGITEILMTVAEFDLLQEEIKTALRDWVLSGGRLLLVDPVNEMDKTKVEGFFKGVSFKGLGAVYLLADGRRPDSVKAGKLSTAENFFGLQKSYFLKEISEPKASFIFFSILLVLFLILLIPVNLLILTKKNRLKLLVTIPVISIGASILFFIVIILSDGFGGAGVKSTLIYVNPELKRCSIFQSQVSRTGIMTSENFKVSNELLIDVYSMTKKRWEKTSYPMKSKIVVNDDNIGGDIFNSRTRRFADIRHIQSTQGAIEIIPGESLKLRSSFQSSIKKIYLRTSDGKYWKARDLQPGELVLAEAIIQPDKEDMAWKLSPLMKGNKTAFFAELNEAGEFDIATHKSIDWKEHKVYVAGPVKEVKK